MLKKIDTCIKKYIYFTLPVIIIIVYMGVLYIEKNIYDFFKIGITKNDLGGIAGISGTLIGFLFTSAMIYANLNKNTGTMERFKKYGHDIIFAKVIGISIFFCVCNIIAWMLGAPMHMFILTFLEALLNSCVVAYYIYKLSTYSFI